jgi:hypothetical protein
MTERARATSSQGLTSPSCVAADEAGDRLDGDVGHAEQDARGAPSMTPW